MHTLLLYINIIVLTIGLTFLLLLAQLPAVKKLNYLSGRYWNKKYLQSNAMVLSVTPTGRYINMKYQVTIQVQVMPDKGKNFVVEIRSLYSMNDLKAIQTGSYVRVKYNPANTKDAFLI
ncbi:hypothetical protein EXU57_03950 [Segetibacter sp. 3557_3]|uniref:hypothetical protein n=1 Tax=Segetibacter sp. 3557_3 TaxID=2547429 RepID=UPI001058A17C|nr:hypothetical protein [Segetibacter sp. 3557_3]TDH29230.1 hypothetical protein EXU57_03950 [Segetibacter sp. 3557_3]